MDFMKILDQTVRDIKREVNLRVLMVPEIEQKVLDATDNEPWGPHGSALAEIAQATKKYTECQMAMSVLWTRLGESGRDWRYVYKALAVIEYLMANGSERAVDEIIEHTFQISSLSGFEYVEPNGKDFGINVRKKAETIVAILNSKDKIEEIRNKAASNRNKYVGLSSSGVTFKSVSSSSYGSDGFNNTKEGDDFKHNDRVRDQIGENKVDRDVSAKSYQGTSRKQSTHYRRNDKNDLSFGSKKALPKVNDSDKCNSKPCQISNMVSNKFEDDFDPRGTSASAVGTSNQVDLFGHSLVNYLMDTPPTSDIISNSDIDLFADSTFVSSSLESEQGEISQPQMKVDLFASQPAFPNSSSVTCDFFSTPEPFVQQETKLPQSGPINTNIVDPFASIPLNSLNGCDLFGTFTSHAMDSISSPESAQKLVSDDNFKKSNGNYAIESKIPNKKDNFQVKSGIWADTLSRGLIDLNISAPKKVSSLADIGVTGGLNEGENGIISSNFTGKGMVGSGNQAWHA